MPRKPVHLALVVIAVTTVATVHRALAAPQAMLKPATIACPPAVKADTHPARDLPGWMQNIANGWLDSAMYDKARHVVQCIYGIHPNPPRGAFTTLEQGVDQTLVNCRVTADQKAVMCDSNAQNLNAPMQAPTRFRNMSN